MNFDPKLYDNLNNDSLVTTKRLIQTINELKLNKKECSTILDIGCGSGNMTKLLSEEISFDRVIGCDIDNKMIEFAQKVNKHENIEYLVQDIQQNWSRFSEEMQALEGKVSVVTSNFALSWIKDIKTAAQNISKLVSKDGYIVVNIVYDGDIYEKLEPKQRVVAEQTLKYPTEEELIGQWIHGFKKSGFTHLDIYYWESKSIYTEKDFFEDFINIPINWYKKYAKNVKNAENMEMNELLKRLVFEDRCKRLDLKSMDGKDLIEVTNYIWQIVASKSC